MAKEDSATRPITNPGEESGASKPVAAVQPPAADETSPAVELVNLTDLSLGDLTGADAGAIVRQAVDPFDGYEIKPQQRVASYKDENGKNRSLMVSPTHIVAFVGKLPRDPAMGDNPAPHMRAIMSRFTNRLEAVSFDRTIGNVPNCAIVTDNSIRSQLVWTTDSKGTMVEDRNYKLVDKDQLMRLAKEFSLRNPGENQTLAKKIMGEE